MSCNFLSLRLLLLMFCAFLPMTPIMSAAVDTLAPGFTADMATGSGQSDLPINNPESKRWDLLQIKAPEAWSITSGGEDTIVAVLDTGIDVNNRELQGKVIEKTRFTTSTGIDARGHGTFIAGIIAAASDNSGITGLAYNSSLLDVQVAENDGSTDARKVAEGMIWAADHGAKVINVSITIDEPYQFLEYAVDYAWKKGCIVVAAAGNNASSQPVYPASYPNVISVAATDRKDRLAKWSNRGDWVSVAAPGVDIFSTLPGDKIGYKSGTSFSTALVSGEAALLFSRVTDSNGDGRVNDEVRDVILKNSDDLENQNQIEERINVYDAAKAADIIRESLILE